MPKWNSTFEALLLLAEFVEVNVIVGEDIDVDRLVVVAELLPPPMTGAVVGPPKNGAPIMTPATKAMTTIPIVASLFI